MKITSPQIPFWMLVAGVLLLGTACEKVESRKDLDAIREMEKALDETDGPGPETEKLIVSLSEAYAKFADDYPDAEESPEFLFRAGELYSNELMDYPLAIEMFLRNYENYPAHPTAAKSLFFAGYLSHNNLHDLIKAEEYYKKFLEDYPDHKMALDAKVELETLGMTPDQVLQQIMPQEELRNDARRIDSIGMDNLGN